MLVVLLDEWSVFVSKKLDFLLAFVSRQLVVLSDF
jgi:hypothetical protein